MLAEASELFASYSEYFFSGHRMSNRKDKLEREPRFSENRSQIGLYEMLALAKADSNHENSALIETLTQKTDYAVGKDEYDK